ncbi:MAG TPA: aspartate kinase [Bacillota bacterium]|nr:aspartate kinase [Bacillota bacterium]
MGIIVQKFGGTSVGTLERMERVANRIIQTREQGHEVVVVVSAMGKSTDILVDMAKQLSGKPSEREMDMLLTTGEQVSISLLSIALQQKGYRAVSLTGWQAGIVTEPVHNKARIRKIDSNKVSKYLKEDNIVIVAGFQGVTEGGQITTLGRGGSDTTAVALAASLQAELCEIYTDVSGVFTADPRIASRARKLNSISYDEMLELANLGAGVLHPRAVECAKRYNVKLTVRSSFGEEEGTMIQEEPDMENGLMISGVAHDESVAKITVVNLQNKIGALSSIFSTLAQAHINVDVIIQSANESSTTTIAFTVAEDDLVRTIDLLKRDQERLNFEEVRAEKGLAKVSIVGAGMVSNPGVAASMFKYLASAGIDILMVSTSEIKVSCIISTELAKLAVQTLHSAFGLDAAELAEVHG